MSQHSLEEPAVERSVPSSETVRVHFGEIDGLRALAVVAALVFEATHIASPVDAWRPILARVFSDASQGVSLFLVISGFVLGYPVFATLREDGGTYLDVGRYLIKRALRIYPAYLVVLALTFVVPPLAMQYGLPALAQGAPEWSRSTFLRSMLFAGSGLGNDGFRVLALEARLFVAFPLLLVLLARAPKAFYAATLLAAIADPTLGVAHAAGIGALVPFMLGMIAADVRAGHLRFERIAFAVAAVALIAAIALEPFVAQLPALAGSTALRIDPLWSLAFFALLCAVATSGLCERVLSLRPLRLLGAASYSIALVMVPVASFVVRQTLTTFGAAASAANAAVVSVVAGIVVWQLADRWFADGALRRDGSVIAGPWLDALLRVLRADRVTLGALPEPEIVDVEHSAVDPSFYAPPPRSGAGEHAVVSQRSGSPEELAFEIMEMKRRLTERTSGLFDDSTSQQPPYALPAGATAAAAAAAAAGHYEKPGFYRRGAPPKPSDAAPPEPPKRAKIPYVEPQPISLSFESKAPVAPPKLEPPAPRAYEHFKLVPPVPEPTHTPPPTTPASLGPSTRGPVKMEKVHGLDAR